MSESPARTLKDIFRPWWMRWFAGPITGIGVYDTVGGQLELPTLWKIIGMSGALMPWWGWLLVFQAIFVAGLFEYVRRNVGLVAPAPPAPSNEDTLAMHRLSTSLKALEKDVTILKEARRAEFLLDTITILLPLLDQALKEGPKRVGDRPAMQLNQVWLPHRFNSELRAVPEITQGLEDEFSPIEQAIRGDARYCVLEEGDSEFFWNSEDRQHYHISVARAKLLRERITKAERMARNALDSARSVHRPAE